MILTKEKGLRMWGGGFGSGGGGGMDAAALAAYATQQFVEETYVGKLFFNTLFTIHGKQTVTVVDGTTSEETVTVTDIILAPNEVPSTTVETDPDTGDVTTTVREITSIEANYGLWTDQFLSALGLNDGGGGGGGASSLGELSDVQLTTPTNGQALVYNETSGKWENQNIGGGGGGGGTLTSIGLVMPTGFSVSPATLTADGSFTVTFLENYRLLTREDEIIIQDGYTAYQWGDHAQAGYATQSWVTGRGYATAGSPTSGTYTQVTINGQGIVTSGTNPTTLAGYGITDAVGTGTTWWGRSINNGAVTGSLSSVIDINMSGALKMDNGQSIQFKDYGGTLRNVLTFNSSNTLALGYGTRLQGYVLDIQGAAASNAASDATAIRLKVGTSSSGISGLEILKDATVFVPLTSPGIRIGNGLISWDDQHSAIKVSMYDGSAANFYSLGAVSALGFQSGSGGTNSATIGTLNVTGQINMTSETRISTPDDLYIGSPDSEGWVYMADLCSQDGSTYWSIVHDSSLGGIAKFSGYVRAPKFYFDASKYLYVSGYNLMFYDGQESYRVKLEQV